MVREPFPPVNYCGFLGYARWHYDEIQIGWPYVYIPGGEMGIKIGEFTGFQGIEDNRPSIPLENCLISAYPNPFNSSTTIRVDGIENSEISVFDITGSMISTLQVSAGHAIWNANGFSSGLYFAKLKDGPSNAIKLILIK